MCEILAIPEAHTERGLGGSGGGGVTIGRSACICVA